MPAMMCRSVVLPQPLRPTITICSPSPTRNSGISNTGSAVPSGWRNVFLMSFSCSIQNPSREGMRYGALIELALWK